VGQGPHATDGYPALTDWPNGASATHTQTYYRWIERAYLSGLRLMVTLATGDRMLCQLISLFHGDIADGDCSPESTIRLQTDFVYDLQDYIDAQEGGAGRGWFRVVTSPAEARAVIRENKLAVVLGVEYAAPFDCREGQTKCTKPHINRELDALHEMGIRSIYAVHRFDNALGGARPGGDWLNLGSKLNTGRVEHILDVVNPFGLLFQPIGGHFFDLDVCPPGVRGRTDIGNMRAFIDRSLPIEDPTLRAIVDAVLIRKLEPIPEYPGLTNGESACNTRPLQELGRHFIHRVVDKGMILEIDHMSWPMLQGAVEVLERRGHSGLVSSHGWLEKNAELRDRTFALGGVWSPYNSAPDDIARTIELYASEMSRYPFPVAVGIGTDTQGLAGQAGSSPNRPIRYPFTSVDGLVTFHPPRTGDRTFDFEREGLAHYGLLPEWVEQLRQYDAQHRTGVLDAFMSAAEGYIQMWERAEQGSP